MKSLFNLMLTLVLSVWKYKHIYAYGGNDVNTLINVCLQILIQFRIEINVLDKIKETKEKNDMTLETGLLINIAIEVIEKKKH